MTRTFKSATDTNPPERTAAELRRVRKDIFNRENDYLRDRTNFSIELKDKGPIGITFFGDLHVDNHGTNLEKIYNYSEIVGNTDGMYAALVGDIVDSWIGRLARLWAKQGVTGGESLTIAKDALKPMKDKLFMVIGGNHDEWTRNTLDLGIIDELRKEYMVSCFQDAARFVLKKPDVKQEVIVHIRHAVKGTSMYNPAHG